MAILNIENLNFDKVKREDSVIIEFGAFESLDVIHEIDLRLLEIIPESVGAHDMHEVAMDDTDGRFFTYGNNAEELFKLMLPVLKDYEFLRNATVHLTFVDGEKERDLEIKLSTITAD